MKVLFLTHWYPNDSKPISGIFIREHAKVVALYDDVTVLHLAGMNAGLRQTWELREELRSKYTEGLPTYRAVHRRPLVPKTAFAYYLRSAFGAFRQLLDQGHRFDIIHAHVYEAGVPAVMLGRRYGLPVVITEHASQFPRRLMPFFQVWKARWAMSNANLVMPVSQALQDGLTAYGIRAHYQIISNVINPTAFFPPAAPRPSQSPLRLLFVGSLLPVKGCHLLLEALAQLGSHPDWRLDIIGDGSERAHLEAFSHSHQLDDRIVFHGYLPKTAVGDFMRQAHALIMPSLWENAPVALIEALACGLPIMASRVGGIPELLGPVEGFLFEPDNPPALAAALSQLLDGTMSFNSDHIVAAAARFSPAAVGQRIHQCYEQLLS